MVGPSLACRFSQSSAVNGVIVPWSQFFGIKGNWGANPPVTVMALQTCEECLGQAQVCQK